MADSRYPGDPPLTKSQKERRRKARRQAEDRVAAEAAYEVPQQVQRALASNHAPRATLPSNPGRSSTLRSAPMKQAVDAKPLYSGFVDYAVGAYSDPAVPRLGLAIAGSAPPPPAPNAYTSSSSRRANPVNPHELLPEFNYTDYLTEMVYVTGERTTGACINLLRPPIAMDVEWTPARVKGQQQNPVALLQLADKHIIILIHVSEIRRSVGKLPMQLINMLSDPRIAKVGCGIREDAKKLEKDLGLKCNGLVDLNDLIPPKKTIGRTGITSTNAWGLAGLTAELLSKRLSKPQVLQQSDWGAPAMLSPGQIHYAANDVYSTVQILDALQIRAFKERDKLKHLSDDKYWDWDNLEIISKNQFRALEVDRLVEQFEHTRLGEAFHPCAPIDPISYAIAHEMVYGENRADFGYSDGDSDGEGDGENGY